MRTKAFILIAVFAMLVLAVSQAGAQEGEIYMSINAGVSIPMLDYAQSDFDNESSGFARPGGMLKLDFGYRLNDYLSLSAMLSGGMNRFDYVELQEWLTANFANTLPDTRWIVESKSWGLGGLLAGITGQLPFRYNKWYLEARLLGGLMYVYSPARYISGKETGKDDILINTEQYASPSWAIDGGLGIRYKHNRSQYFILGADYLLAHPKYNNVETTSSIGLETAESFSQRVSTLNISLGLGYVIN